MIRLIATDLDGTLLGDDKIIPQEIFGLANELRKQGIIFVPASGRSPYTLRENFRPIADGIDYICDNGAVAICNGETVLSLPVPTDVVRDVWEFCRNEDVHMLLCGSQTTYLAPVEGTKYEPHVRPYYFKRVSYDELADITDSVNKIAICDMRNPTLSGSYNRLVKMLGDRATTTVSGEIWMDVMRNGVNKGEGLKAIQQKKGITPQQTVVFGDYYNDAPMMSVADYSYVMSNANADMFKYGNLKAESNNNGGVLKVIRRIVAEGENWKPLPSEYVKR